MNLEPSQKVVWIVCSATELWGIGDLPTQQEACGKRLTSSHFLVAGRLMESGKNSDVMIRPPSRMVLEVLGLEEHHLLGLKLLREAMFPLPCFSRRKFFRASFRVRMLGVMSVMSKIKEWRCASSLSQLLLLAHDWGCKLAELHLMAVEEQLTCVYILRGADLFAQTNNYVAVCETRFRLSALAQHGTEWYVLSLAIPQQARLAVPKDSVHPIVNQSLSLFLCLFMSFLFLRCRAQSDAHREGERERARAAKKGSKRERERERAGTKRELSTRTEINMFCF